MQLIRYEAARTALAECHRVDEVKDIRDRAEAMAAYARQAKDSDLIQYATEIKVRAERRCGELLRATEKNAGARGTGSNQHRKAEVPSHDASAPPTLEEMGLTHNESSRYQQLAAMPAEHFETAVATAKATAGEVTTAFMLREAKKLAPEKRPRAERVAEIRALVNSGHNPEQIADSMKISIGHLRHLLSQERIKVPIQKRGRGIDPNRVVREAVAALSGIAQGLSLVHGLDIDAEEATGLLSELRSAMKALRTLDATLKEIVNGK